MVLDQLVIAALLSSAPIAQEPSYERYAPLMRAYVEFDDPSEAVSRDTLPGARTDKYTLERPRTRYQK